MTDSTDGAAKRDTLKKEIQEARELMRTGTIDQLRAAVAEDPYFWRDHILSQRARERSIRFEERARK